MLELGSDAIVIGGIGYYGDALKILGGGAQHGGTADVDVFDELFRGEFLLGGSSFKGIQVDDDEVNRGDAVLGGLLLIFGMIAAKQQPAMHFGVQSLHAPAEPFRELQDSGFVKDADERALHCHVIPSAGKAQQCKRPLRNVKAETGLDWRVE